jgi:hypothetical protein
MCWNAAVSMNSFLFGIGAIIIGGIYGISVPLLFFYSTIVFMQLIEYIVWTYPSNQINFYASVSASFLLWLQPIAAILTMTRYKLITASMYCILSILSSLNDTWRPNVYKMYPGTNGHLVWKWLKNDKSLWIYFLFLLAPIFLIVSNEMIFIILATLITSLYGYYKTNTWGSMWCWLVDGLVIISCLNAVKLT